MIACDLKPFLVNQAKKGSAGAILLLERVEFLADKFHCEKHTELTCMPPDNPKCEYHPSNQNLQKYMALIQKAVNKGFCRLNRYKDIINETIISIS